MQGSVAGSESRDTRTQPTNQLKGLTDVTDMTTVTNPNYVPGYSVAMRTHDGETLAVMPRTYEDGRGRYYIAFSLTDGWVELDPAFVTGRTKPTLTFPTALKRAVDRLLGHDLHVAPRVYG